MPANHDADSLDCLTPSKPGPGTPLHYAQESKSGSYASGVFAIVTPRFKLPSVVLDYANAANSIKVVRGGDLVIAFSTFEAFLQSVESWKVLTEVVFVTFTPGCGDYDDGERCYFLANQLNFDQTSLSVRATGKARNIRDLAEYIDVSWGSYNDEGFSSGAPGVSGTNGDASASSTGASKVSSPTLTPGSNGASFNGTNSTVVNIRKDADDCVAPIDTKFGLPTSCNGPQFDNKLDTRLGYHTSKDFSWNDWATTLLLDNPDNDPLEFVADPADTATLKKRNWFANTFKKVTGFVGTSPVKFVDKSGAAIKVQDLPKDVQAVMSASQGASGIAIKTAVGVGVAGKIAHNAMTGTPNIVSEKWEQLLLPPRKNSTQCITKPEECALKSKDAKAVKTPWDDDGILLKSFGKAPSESELKEGRTKKKAVKGQFLNIYCVRCGLTGSAKVEGRVTIYGTDIIEGKLDVDASMDIGVGIGVYAQYLRKETWNTNLFNVPLTPFTIGVLTVGPFLSIGSRASITVNATGVALARADLTFAKAKFSHDFKNGTSSQIGFNPVFKPKFEAEGEIKCE